MNYQLTCQCGRVLVVGRSQAGQEIECSCGKKVSIPTLRGLSTLPLVADPSIRVGASTRTQAAETTWKGWRGVMISLSAAVGIIALALLAWFAFERLQVDTSYTEDVERTAGREMIDNMEIEDLSSLFEQFRTHGLGVRSPPPFKLIEIYARQREQYAMICGGVALAAGVLGGVIALIRPKNKGLNS